MAQDRDQSASATAKACSPWIALLGDSKTGLLTTYRRDLTPVSTPVSIVVDGSRVLFRTWDTSGKYRRIRSTARVSVAPSTFRGKPLGPDIEAVANVLDGAAAVDASRALARRHRVLHGLLIPLAHRLRRFRTVHLEVTLRVPA